MALCRRRLLTTLARQVDGRSRAGMPINYGALSAPTQPVRCRAERLHVRRSSQIR